MGAVAILAFGLLLTVAYLVVRAFFAPASEAASEPGETPLIAQKEKVLDAIREIDMDFATGKLSDDDYRNLRSAYVAEAAKLVRAAEQPAVTEAPASDGDGRASAPAAPDTATPATAPRWTALEDEIERQIGARKATIERQTCPGCGLDRTAEDQFCRRCGARLPEARG